MNSLLEEGLRLHRPGFWTFPLHSPWPEDLRFERPGFKAVRSFSGAADRGSYRVATQRHLLGVTLAGRTDYSASRLDGGPLVERPDRPGVVSFTPAGRERFGVMIGVRLVSARFEIEDWFVSEASETLRCDHDWRPLYNEPVDRLRTAVSVLIDAMAQTQVTVPRVTIETLAVVLVREVARRSGRLRRRAADGRLHPAAIRRVVDRIDAELHRDLSLDMLARDVGVGVSAFLRGFYGSVGQTPGAFLIERRLERAATILLGSDMSVGSIGAGCGFASPSHFANAFKVHYGLSPRAFRSSRTLVGNSSTSPIVGAGR